MTGNNVARTSLAPAAGTGSGQGSGTASSPGLEDDLGKPAAPGPATVSGNNTSLNPADGLFLRAQHLEQMQVYTRRLSLAIGIGVGTGVVYGFGVTLGTEDDKPVLRVQPGLAISPIGRVLRSATAAVVSLAPNALGSIGPDGFWVVEVDHAWWLSGSENVFGNLCDEPCSASASKLQPWRAEGITVSLRADNMPGLSSVDAEPMRRRNWLASQYFERERRLGDPWLVPGTAQKGVVSSIKNHDWAAGTEPPVRSAVPLGVIQRVGQTWVLDVWTARRDIGAPPADNVWRARLAMRPWNVFLAEVLQFQDQLRSVPTMALAAEQEAPEDLGDVVKTFITRVEHTPVARTKAFKELVSKQQEAAAPRAAVPALPSLSDQGFDELPPAGFLVREATGDALRPWLGGLFGPRVDVRICHVRADYVLGAVEDAQHLDRIPLTSALGRAKVDVLVPDVAADLKGLRADDYGWIAFVRCRDADCDAEPEPGPGPEPVEKVAVYSATGAVDQIEAAFRAGTPPTGATKAGELSYPASSWEYPGSDVALKVAVQSGTTILAVASSDERRPLAALRAGLFAASLDGGITLPPVRASTLQANAADRTETIVVVRRPPGPQ